MLRLRIHTWPGIRPMQDLDLPVFLTVPGTNFGGDRASVLAVNELFGSNEIKWLVCCDHLWTFDSPMLSEKTVDGKPKLGGRGQQRL